MSRLDYSIMDVANCNAQKIEMQMKKERKERLMELEHEKATRIFILICLVGIGICAFADLVFWLTSLI